MKDYRAGRITCNCSKRMKKGKIVKVYNFLSKWICPNSNCKKTDLVAERIF
jgi:hypothetical protein